MDGPQDDTEFRRLKMALLAEKTPIITSFGILRRLPMWKPSSLRCGHGKLLGCRELRFHCPRHTPVACDGCERDVNRAQRRVCKCGATVCHWCFSRDHSLHIS